MNRFEELCVRISLLPSLWREWTGIRGSQNGAEIIMFLYDNGSSDSRPGSYLHVIFLELLVTPQLSRNGGVPLDDDLAQQHR